MDYFNSVEDGAPVHVLDLIKCWPQGMNPSDMEPADGCKWKYHTGNTWSIVDINGVEYFEGHWLNYHENKKKYSQPAPHIFDLINYWPQAHRQCLGTKDLPEGWMWQWMGDGWVLSNGTIGLVRADWFKYKDIQVAAQPVETKTVTAASMLHAALGHMEDRAKTYDTPGGERSMGKTVSAFNTITGHNLTEEQGWLFMEILKQVRSQQGNYRADNYEDMVAYAALRGECAARERGDK